MIIACSNRPEQWSTLIGLIYHTAMGDGHTHHFDRHFTRLIGTCPWDEFGTILRHDIEAQRRCRWSMSRASEWCRAPSMLRLYGGIRTRISTLLNYEALALGSSTTLTENGRAI